MSSPIADGVLAATHRLVQQAMSGQWNEVPKTVEERRVLLDRLSSGASPQDQQWLSALREAMAESDALVAAITPSPDRSPSAVMGRSPNATSAGAQERPPAVAGSNVGFNSASAAATAQGSTAEVDLVMNMIRGSK